MVLFAFLTIGVYACGESSGGTGGSSGTAPVTTITGTPSGGVTVITFSCTDDSGSCAKTFVAVGATSYDWVDYDVYDAAGKTVEVAAISGTTTVMYFSTDSANNVETIKTATYY